MHADRACDMKEHEGWHRSYEPIGRKKKTE